MSVCGHDPYCPGHGSDHEAALAREEANRQIARERLKQACDETNRKNGFE